MGGSGPSKWKWRFYNILYHIVKAKALAKEMRDMVKGINASLENLAIWRDEAGTTLDSLQ